VIVVELGTELILQELAQLKETISNLEKLRAEDEAKYASAVADAKVSMVVLRVRLCLFLPATTMLTLASATADAYLASSSAKVSMVVAGRKRHSLTLSTRLLRSMDVNWRSSENR
jgi:hypothetical protein